MHKYQHIKVPAQGQKITVNADNSLNVPDEPVIPFIEGDGTGVDISPVMLKVVDAAVAKAYGGKKKIHWMEVFAGEKSTKVYGPDVWLPEETLHAVKDYVNPGSLILSAEMMLRHMGWVEAADLIISAMQNSIKSKKVTYDFARLMEGATQVSCSGFGQVMIDHM